MFLPSERIQNERLSGVRPNRIITEPPVDLFTAHERSHLVLGVRVRQPAGPAALSIAGTEKRARRRKSSKSGSRLGRVAIAVPDPAFFRIDFMGHGPKGNPTFPVIITI